MEINQEAPAIASGAIQIAAPPEVVWDVLTAFERWPSWNPDVKSVAVSGPLAEGTEFKWQAARARSRRRSAASTRRRSSAGPARRSGSTPSTVWRLAARDGGTRVETAESWQGWLPRLLGGRARRMLQQSLDDALPRLKAEGERRSASAAG